MTGKVAIAPSEANRGSAVLGIENPKTRHIQSAINDVVRANFKKKTWAYLDLIIGRGERTCKHRLACTRDYDLLDVALLLGSEIGDKIEAAILAAADKRPGWFKKRERNAKRADILKQIQQLELDLLEDEKSDALRTASPSVSVLAEKPKR